MSQFECVGETCRPDQGIFSGPNCTLRFAEQFARSTDRPVLVPEQDQDWRQDMGAELIAALL